jgi:hypothetical protein
VTALHQAQATVVGRFSVSLKPAHRVPQYVAARLGAEPAVLEDAPTFADVLPDLRRFLGDRPVIAQDAALTWALLEAAARALAEPWPALSLLDLNLLAVNRLALPTKPTLALVAARLGIGVGRIAHPDEEARVLGVVLARLATEPFTAPADALPVVRLTPAATPVLRRRTTPQGVPAGPGVYVLRDAAGQALYVGKARDLQARVGAYVDRPLGATRRLQGLVGTVAQVETHPCATDVEALVLEAREIARLHPRFNTVRQQQPPRCWLQLPPEPPAPGPRQRPRAPRRLVLHVGPPADSPSPHSDFRGPFRTSTLAQLAQRIAREVFDLDALRRADRERYDAALRNAWDWLGKGSSPAVEAMARQRSARVLRRLLAFDPRAETLPADPRVARYAVLRRTPEDGLEVFVVDRGCLVGHAATDDPDDRAPTLVRALLARPRTSAADQAIVLRWLGAQSGARAELVWLDPASSEPATLARAADSAWARWTSEA